MKKIAIKISCISFLSMIISGCAFSNDALFPSLLGTEPQEEIAGAKTSAKTQDPSLPMLGTTDFEPIEISKVSSTGTFVGQKVATFRNELNQLQKSVSSENRELQQVRTAVINNAVQYHKLVGAIEAKLQVGTTPGNPQMFAALQSAQGNVQAMGMQAIALNQLSNRISADSTTTNYLLDSIRSTYSVSGAVDEDHRQLRLLENEANQIGVIVNSLLGEVNSDAARQQQYVETANSNLLVLDSYIRQGHYGVGTVAGAGYIKPLANPNFGQAPSIASGKPLFTAKFNNANVDYKDGLKKAVNSATAKKPNVLFEVVAVSPVGGSQLAQNNARKRATEIFQEMIDMGVGADKITISAKSNNDSTSPEIQIFVK